MLSILMQGLLVSGGLIIAIGAQNAFILRQGLLNQRVFYACTVCFICDATLITLGVLGVGSVLQESPFFLNLLAIVGVIFLYSYGFLAFWRAYKGTSKIRIEQGEVVAQSAAKLILAAFAITLLNPHVYLDTLVLVGGIGGTLDSQEKPWFLAGAILASFLWFYGLGFASKKLIPFFESNRTWKILDSLIGLIMLWIATGLITFVYQS